MATILIILIFLFFFINLPIYIAIALATLVVAFLAGDEMLLLPQNMVSTLNSFPLMAIPFFILAGKLMEFGGISQKLIGFANSIAGHLRGGLAHVSIISCMLFAAISGSAIATTVAIGAIMIPYMVKNGYDRAFSSALLGTGGIIGGVILPSIPMVIYAVSAGVSIGKMFLSGILPGILLAVSLMITSYIVSLKKGYGEVAEKKSVREIWISFKGAIWALLMPVIILGGIYGGFFTPTESAVVAIVYGFLVGIFVYKLITFDVLKKIFHSTVITTSVVGVIIATASYFGSWLTLQQVPQSIALWFSDANLTPIMTIMLINIFLLIVGTFMDATASLIIATPILLPVAEMAGLDPIHFGIIMILNLGVGLITPPLGVSLFVAAKVGETSYESLLKPAVIFIVVMIMNVILVTLLPQLSVGFAEWLER